MIDSRDYFITWSHQDTEDTLKISHGEGSHFILETGEVVFDMLSTSFQASFGHSQPIILSRIRDQMNREVVAFSKAETDLKSRATRRLLDYIERKGKIFYTVSGAEGIENALKIARQIRRAPIVLAREKSYHGASLGALSVTGDWRNQAHKTLVEWTRRIPEPGDVRALEKTRELIEEIGADNIAAFCLETITGANGVYTASQEWWKGIDTLCKEYGILLILDEVLCGFGRTGKPFAFHHYGLNPHMVVMGKAISGGYIPFGALYVESELAEFYKNQVLACGLTHYAHPLGLAAMEGVLDLLTGKGFLKMVGDLEMDFETQVKELLECYPVNEVRVAGLLAAADLAPGNGLSWKKFAREGAHVYCNQNRLVLAPPLVMSREQLGGCMATVKRVLSEEGGS